MTTNHINESINSTESFEDYFECARDNGYIYYNHILYVLKHTPKYESDDLTHDNIYFAYAYDTELNNHLIKWKAEIIDGILDYDIDNPICIDGKH